MKRYVTLSLVLIVLTSSARADSGGIDELKVGMPADVAETIDRIVGCNHWLGEEPFDQDRANEITHALAELKCGQIGGDVESLRAKYQAKPNVGRALDAARGMSY